MSNNKKEFGTHYIVDFFDCDPEKLKFVKELKGPFIEAARKSKTTMLNNLFHQFEPFGVSGIIVIAESHFAIHTWPEDNFAALDILTCGTMDAEISIQELKKYFCAKEAKIRIITRGV